MVDRQVSENLFCNFEGRREDGAITGSRVDVEIRRLGWLQNFSYSISSEIFGLSGKTPNSMEA
jgi:hypothetical protein